MVNIVYTVSTRVEDGPQIAKTGTLVVDAYDVTSVTVTKKTGGVNGTASVVIQPATEDGATFLAMYSDSYTALTYTVDGGTSITCNGPIMMIGGGAIALLGNTQLIFEFTNADTVADAHIMIFVGRDGTEPQQG